MPRGAQKIDSGLAESFRRLAWDDVQIFLAVASAGSFKSAAKMLNSSINTVRNHIKRLEDVLGAPIVERSFQGISLTRMGLQLADVAKEMAAASLGVPGGIGAHQSAKDGGVHFHITEGIGTFWMVPRLVDFRNQNPHVLIRLDCTMVPLARFDKINSVAVQMVRPDDPNAVCVHLGALHFLPFASHEYIRANGVPRDLQEVLAHRIVLQTGEQVREDIFPALFGEKPPATLVALETNSSAAHYWAIAKGLGIGFLPTYARAITKSIVPIDMGLMFRRDLWLSYPIAAKEMKSVASVIRWIRESFDPIAYPWFSNDFVHPNAFEEGFSGTNVVRLFAGFMDIGENAS